MEQNVTVIGKAEYVDFPELGLKSVPARIDTGAKTSAIWASGVRLDGDELRFVLFGPGSLFYTGEEIGITEFGRTVVSSSNGARQQRFVVKLQMRLGGKKVRATFTLADRSQQVYPVLVGRKTLSGKFVVDVKQGRSLIDEERERSSELRKSVGESQ